MRRCAEAKRHRTAARRVLLRVANELEWDGRRPGNGDDRSLEIAYGTAFCVVSGCIRSDRLCVPVCFKVGTMGKNMERNKGNGRKQIREKQRRG